MKVVGIKYKTKGKCTEIRNNRERKDCSDERVLVVTVCRLLSTPQKKANRLYVNNFWCHNNADDTSDED